MSGSTSLTENFFSRSVLRIQLLICLLSRIVQWNCSFPFLSILDVSRCERWATNWFPPLMMSETEFIGKYATTRSSLLWACIVLLPRLDVISPWCLRFVFHKWSHACQDQVTSPSRAFKRRKGLTLSQIAIRTHLCTSTSFFRNLEY